MLNFVRNLPDLSSRNTRWLFATSQVQLQRLKGRKGKYSEKNSIQLYTFFFLIGFFKIGFGYIKLWRFLAIILTSQTSVHPSSIYRHYKLSSWISQSNPSFFRCGEGRTVSFSSGICTPQKKKKTTKNNPTEKQRLSFRDNAKLQGFEVGTVHKDLEEVSFLSLMYLAEYPREVRYYKKKAIPANLRLPTPCLLGTAWYWVLPRAHGFWFYTRLSFYVSFFQFTVY